MKRIIYKRTTVTKNEEIFSNMNIRRILVLSNRNTWFALQECSATMFFSSENLRVPPPPPLLMQVFK